MLLWKDGLGTGTLWNSCPVCPWSGAVSVTDELLFVVQGGVRRFLSAILGKREVQKFRASEAVFPWGYDIDAELSPGFLWQKVIPAWLCSWEQRRKVCFSFDRQKCPRKTLISMYLNPLSHVLIFEVFLAPHPVPA